MDNAEWRANGFGPDGKMKMELNEEMTKRMIYYLGVSHSDDEVHSFMKRLLTLVGVSEYNKWIERYEVTYMGPI